jgi:hypothetical protein
MKKSTRNSSSTPSVLPGVPMLTLNPSNIGDVAEALNSLCLREFETIGEAIATLTLSAITSLPNSPIDLTPYSAANDPHGFAAKAYQDDVKQRKSELEKRKRELLKLYGYVLQVFLPTRPHRQRGHPSPPPQITAHDC